MLCEIMYHHENFEIVKSQDEIMNLIKLESVLRFLALQISECSILSPFDPQICIKWKSRALLSSLVGVAENTLNYLIPLIFTTP